MTYVIGEPLSAYAGLFKGFGWINIFGIIIDVLLLIPLIIFAVKFKNRKHGPVPKCFSIGEKIFIFICLGLMVWNLGLEEYAFKFDIYFELYLLSNIVLLVAYYAIWVSFFFKQRTWKRIATACIMLSVFIFSAMWLDHRALGSFVAWMGVTHVFVAAQDKYDTETDITAPSKKYKSLLNQS